MSEIVKKIIVSMELNEELGMEVIFYNTNQ
jgi:hypothetical protein